MSDDVHHMARAIELAARGEGRVEPNPMVGCVIVRDGVRVAEGWHQQFGGLHAEVAALRSATGEVAGATMYVTLEPCCHTGKTPPCTNAIIDARVARVVVAQTDPFPAVAGQGMRMLQAAGIAVDVGVLKDEARRLTAPYCMLVEQGRPWIIAKWAMTLDGKIASRTGHSRWISNELSRRRVHQLRGRVDAIMVGFATAITDDPLLLAQPPGPRVATRIVMDSAASLPLDSRLVKSRDVAPVLVAVGIDVDEQRLCRLRDAGCDVLICPGTDHAARMQDLITELGRRQMTNVLVEGGGRRAGHPVRPAVD